MSMLAGLSWQWVVGGTLSAIFVGFVGMLAYANLPSAWILPQKSASEPYLASAKLQTIPSGLGGIPVGDNLLDTRSLWKENGAVIMAVRRPGWQLCRDEALALSKIEPELAAFKVPLLAVLHETLGADEFRNFFKGPLYLDTEKTFYGPNMRKMLLLGFLRFDTWMNIYRSKQLGTEGNLKGDGTLLGAVYVLGPGDQGIVYEHREGTFGDNVNVTEVLEAVQKMNKHH